jgi:hypothetical protein
MILIIANDIYVHSNGRTRYIRVSLPANPSPGDHFEGLLSSHGIPEEIDHWIRQV